MSDEQMREDFQMAIALDKAEREAQLHVTIAQLNGMVWWLATELATDDVGRGGEVETWLELAEKHWPQGLRSQTRFLSPKTGDEDE